MSDYDQEFYGAYREYLREPGVRSVHDWVFDVFVQHVGHQWTSGVVDLGCGLQEFGSYVRDLTPWCYIGLDKNGYPSWDFADPVPEADIFVSLFAAECVLGPAKYEFYKRAFAESGAEYGLVSGFYYRGREHETLIPETGGIVSYQTVEPQPMHSEFREWRLVVSCPSRMFGPDVVEVWKILERA